MSESLNSNFFKLDNPVWYSLMETHQRYALPYSHLLFYQPSYCAFGAIGDQGFSMRDVTDYRKMTHPIYLVGEKPPSVIRSIGIEKEILCLQMVLEAPIQIDTKENIQHLWTPKQNLALSNLINEVQPGYFQKYTYELGDYYGIFKNDSLVAVCGERMKMHHYTEVSAIVTHPRFTGQGLASQLIKHATDQILEQKKTPFLHVVESNTAAIRLYKKLGFKTRRKISFWKYS